MKNLKKSVFILLSILSLAIFSCDSWMKDDDFFSDIENQVKVANAPKINVYVRYAMNRQGKTAEIDNQYFISGHCYHLKKTIPQLRTWPDCAAYPRQGPAPRWYNSPGAGGAARPGCR